MSEPRESRYIHGTEPQEQRRLARLNDLMNEGSLRALDLRRGDLVLDLGSGLGQLSRSMARKVGPGGRVIGIERDPAQIETARRLAREAGEEGLVEFRQGTASELPISEQERGAFDVAHARFVLEHVREPQAIVDAMARAVRPGGRVVLEDDDHDLLRLWPEAPGFERLWQAYIASYRRLGNDPYVGRQLASLLEAAGATPHRTDMLFFGGCAGDATFPAFVDNFVGLVVGAAETIVESSTMDRGELEEAVASFEAWGQRADAALWYATCWAEGRRESGTSDPLRPASARPLRPRRKVDSSRLLAESAADLNSSLRLDEVFELVAERVQQLIDCHLFCVLLWNESAQLLEHSYSLRFGEHIPQEGGFPLGYGISGSAAATRAPIRVDDVREDSRYVRYRHSEVEIRSELAVPLIVKDRLIGVLDLESQQLAAFSEEHEQIVLALAGQIATALENARLYEELRRKERRLESDLQTARTIQRALLPASAPSAAGLDVGAAFAPARELSGDFYDWVRYPDGRIGLALGDVAGKSTAAALYGSLAVGMLRGHALEHAGGPAALLGYFNQALHTMKVDRRFVALSLALYDPIEKTLTLGSAGVPQPLLVREGSVRPVEVSGVPAGGLAEARYEEVSIVLEPGDAVAVFSDGLEDCTSSDGERFGDRRLAVELRRLAGSSAQEIADGLVAASDAFAAAAGDDRTLIVVKAV